MPLSMTVANKMGNQLREPLEAPKFWRKVSLQQGKKLLPPGAATCIVHFRDDVDIIFPDMDAPGKLKIHDHRSQQEFEVNEHVVSLADMQIEGVVQTAEEAYLKNNAPFSDPYQR